MKLIVNLINDIVFIYFEDSNFKKDTSLNR